MNSGRTPLLTKQYDPSVEWVHNNESLTITDTTLPVKQCWKIRYFLLGNFPELNFKSCLLNQKFYVTFMNWLIQMTYECLDRLHTCFKYELENIGWLWKFRLTTTGAALNLIDRYKITLSVSDVLMYKSKEDFLNDNLIQSQKGAFCNSDVSD
jgi:hypothetical protein